MKQFKIKFTGKEYIINYITKLNEAYIVAKKLAESDTQNFGLDIETRKLLPEYEKSGLDPHTTAISTLQLYDGKDDVYVFDCLALSKSTIAAENGTQQEVQVGNGLDWFKHLKEKSFVAHYGIFEIKHLTHAGFPDLNVGCSMLLSILVDRAERSPYVDEDNGETAIEEDEEEPSTWKGYGLDAIIGRLFDIRVEKKWQVHDWGARPIEGEALKYAALDAVLTYKIAKVQVEKVTEYKMVKHYKLLKDLQHVVAEMELQGVEVDAKAHKKLIKRWTKDQKQQDIECAKYFGDINLNSTKQLGQWAKEKYSADELTHWPKTKKGVLGFGKNALAAMQTDPAIASLLKHKKTAKLISTYGETLHTQRNPITNRIHCSFSLGETRTGRFSSRDPNLQNLPRDSDMRNIFIAAPGKKLIVADFNQIELRVAGELSGDPVIRGAYERGDDLHTIFAAKMYHVPVGKVTKEQRQIAKSANFGAIYGMGGAKFQLYVLANTGMHIELEEAKYTINSLWQLYSVYAAYCKKVRAEAELVGFARTPLGKIRKLHPKEVYTKAVNTKVQGGAFEVMGLAMVQAKALLKCDTSKIINSVHDEIIIEVEEEDADFTAVLVKQSMEYGMKKIFPKATLNNLANPVVCERWGDGK